MGLADCNIAGTRGVSCAREMKVKDFRVLRALMELHAQGESVTVDGIVDYLKKQRYDTVPFYDDTIVNSAIQLGVAQRRRAQGEKFLARHHHQTETDSIRGRPRQHDDGKQRPRTWHVSRLVK